jgi:hypothetical protein
MVRVTYGVCRDLTMYSRARQSVRMHMQVSVIKGVSQTAAIGSSPIQSMAPQRIQRRTYQIRRSRENTACTNGGIERGM